MKMENSCSWILKPLHKKTSDLAVVITWSRIHQRESQKSVKTKPQAFVQIRRTMYTTRP